MGSKMIRQIAHTFLFIILYSSTIYSQWFQQNPKFITNSNLKSVFFINEMTGYIAGWNGTILKTEDGGGNWEIQTSGTDDYLRTIHFIDNQLGFAGGNQSFLKTTNGGLNWFPILNNYDTRITQIFSTDNNTVYAVGFEGNNDAVYKSTDLGNNWNIIYNSSFQNLNCVFFLDSETGFVGGQYWRKIHKTTDGGTSWTLLDSAYAGGINSIYFSDQLTGFAGGSFGVTKTTNGGLTWVPSLSVSLDVGSVYDLKFVSPDTGFALSFFSWEFGHYAKLYKTTNAGLTWQSISFGNHFMASLFFIGDTKGYSVGSYGKILKTTNGGLSWYRPNSISSASLNSIDITENDIVYVAGSSGTLLKSTNGGDVWFSLVSGTANHLRDIEFINSNLGYCVGDSGTILKTTDGGLTWFPQISGTTENLYSIFIVDANNLYIGGTNGTILKSVDGGIEWSIQNSDVTNTIEDMHFIDNDTGFASGRSFLISTTDGGTNWIQIYTGGFHYDIFTSIYFQNINVGYITSSVYAPDFSVGEIWKTNDGGNNWIQLYSTGNYLNDIVFIDENLGFAAGVGGTIVKTTNSGSVWQIEETPTIEFVRDIDFSIPIGGYLDGFAVGQDGIILKRGGITSVKSDETLITNYSLSQNYPNPFNPSTIIQYAVSNRQFVNLKVYDVLGNEISTLVNEEKPAGVYEVEFISKGLPSGVYLYRLSVDNNYNETRKMLLIK